MTTAPIDPATINTWEDAFKHPIPAVRALERQLRVDLQANKEKLRELVGESYRDLLQTAHRIIDMDVAAKQLEQHLGEASRNCNSRLLDKKAANLRRFYESDGLKESEKFGLAARLAVLQSCPTVLARLLLNDRGDKCLLSAQVLVISRLLLKSFSDQTSTIPLVDSLRDQLGLLRSALLHHIDSLLSSGGLHIPILVSTMSAYTVLKSASPVDVLRQFLSIRARSISSLASDNSTPTSESILESVKLFNKTLVEVDSIFPRQLQRALLAIKGRSVLQDPNIQVLAELGLDVNGRWLPDDVKGFIPWIRHDDLEVNKVVEMMESWAAKEVEKLHQNLKTAVDGVTGLEELVKLRQALLQEFKRDVNSRKKFIDVGNEEYRTILMRRFNDIVSEQVNGLDKVADVAEQLLPDAEKESKDTTSLWSSSLLNMDLSSGALPFREAISARVHGKSGIIHSFIASYTSFRNIISACSTTINTLRVSNSPSSSAADDLEEDFETEEQMAEDGAADATSAGSALSTALDTAYHRFEGRIKKMAEKADKVRRRTFLIRIVRYVRLNPPARDGEVLLTLPWFGLGVVPELQNTIAMEVTKGPLEMLENWISENTWDRPVSTKSLWEGEPPLPTLPSQMVFRFLRLLVAEMSAVGDDIWTAAAVKNIKAYSCDYIWRILAPSLRNLSLQDSNALAEEPGTETEAPSESVKETEAADDDKLEEESTGTVETEATLNPETEESSPSPPPKSPKKSITPSTSPIPAQPETVTTMITSDQIHQLLFDSLYLDEVLHRRRKRGQPSTIGSVASLAAKVDGVVGKALHVEEELRIRLEGSAREYWKKTGLLFGLLAT
ncbi:hypothetical protein EX30DRAFT_360721 [Ascodesmis nigricans]|uniref:Conserved oligomeric Golgi complex subunit 1 n=1 Tax=Ascodesmis nigricans TaxID=341454 RepID=A0A4S2N5Z0_9PEZI|nr:hypothetical protein EX30DRAFT_360721 [Ascodesmis nigricans]